MIQGLKNSAGLYRDAEYIRIMQEMRALGLAPGENKTADIQRLDKAKSELVQRIQKKQETTDSQNELGVQVIHQVDESEYAKKTELETQRLGAMTIAELNKFYFGL